MEGLHQAGAEDRVRVFVSYSHEDRSQFEHLRTTLEGLGHRVLSDRNIGAGTPFSDAIKGLINHAHLFLPFITQNAQERPWVHQETGYAMARNIPILPVVLKDVDLPGEMIAQLHAICVETDLSDLEARLREASIETLVVPQPPPISEMIRVAEWPEQRTEWLAQSGLPGFVGHRCRWV